MSAEETVTVQTAFDFYIKKEPIEDEPFHHVTTVSFNQQENAQDEQDKHDRLESTLTKSEHEKSYAVGSVATTNTRNQNCDKEGIAFELEESKSDYKKHFTALEHFYEKQMNW